MGIEITEAEAANELMRLARAIAASHPEVDAPAESSDERAAIEAEAEAGAGVPRAPRRGRSATPSPEDWAALPRDERVEQFRAASVATRVRYLHADHESKLAMLRELRGRELIETLAGFVARGGGATVLSILSPDELLEAMLADPDPAAVAQLVPRLSSAQRRAVIPALSPSQIAALLADPTHDRSAAWTAVDGAVPDDTTREALRRLSDDQLIELDDALAPGDSARLRALVPAERRRLFPSTDGAA